ncbi:MAG TPA: MCP four helix bundle domain-containing protein, partial [Candidatus Sulfopaludibacter sp.]|nr:MCP four helix bundle domain-containing protein [Candidatus Sulfopaludibacter sp.]
MKNWKIGTRIAAGFAAVIAIALALGIFAYGEVGGIQEKATAVAENALPKVYLLGQIEKNVQLTYSLALQHIMATDVAKMAGVESQIQSIRTANSGFVSEYEKLINSDKGRSLFQEFSVARATFWKSLDEMLNVGRAGTPEMKRRAAEILNSQLQPLQQKYAEAMENVISYNRTIADETGKSAQAAAAGTRVGILV